MWDVPARTIDRVKALADVEVEQRHERATSDGTAHAAAFHDETELEVVGARAGGASAVKALLEYPQHLVILLRLLTCVHTCTFMTEIPTAGSRLAGISTGGGLGKAARRRRNSRPMPVLASSSALLVTSCEAVATGASTLCCAGAAAVARALRL